MDPERWSRVEALFHASLDLAAEDRERFLRAECGPDDALRAEIESLLERARGSGAFLEASALEDAARARISTAAEPPPGGSPAPDLSGEVIAHFRIVRRLGEGGMGVVYERSTSASSAAWR